MKPKKDLSVQHDRELADRIRRRNTPLRSLTDEEKDYHRKRKAAQLEAATRLSLAQEPFKPKPTKQGSLF